MDQQALDRLHELLLGFASRETIKPGLQRISALCQALDNPQERFPAIHVTGTNGKGSVSAMLASALQACGLKVGLYTSPHLHRWSERIRVDGDDIALPTLISLVEGLRPTALEVQATVFELVTAAALAHFKQERVDVAVVEVGLGGRFDATNVVRPILAVITGIGLDHTDLLGGTVEEIAWEKVGIAKRGAPLVCAPLSSGARRVVQDACDALEIVPEGTPPFQRLGFDWQAQTFRMPGWGTIRLPLLGSYQGQNLATALAGLELLEPSLHLNRGKLKLGLESVCWPGRFEIASESPLVILDGAHNPQAADWLLRTLQDYEPLLPQNAGRWLLLGMREDKDYATVARSLSPWFTKLMLAPIEGMRGLDPARLLPYAQLRDPDARVFRSAAEAVGHFQSCASRNDLLCVTGSFYLVGEVRWLLSTR